MPIEFFDVMSYGFNIIIEASELSYNGVGSRVFFNVTLHGDNFQENHYIVVDIFIILDPDILIFLPNEYSCYFTLPKQSSWGNCKAALNTDIFYPFVNISEFIVMNHHQVDTSVVLKYFLQFVI